MSRNPSVRDDFYEGRMIPNSAGYDPGAFSARDPVREEMTGRRTYISGRKIGTGGNVVADNRVTTGMLRPRGGPMTMPGPALSRRQKFSMDMEAQNQAMLRQQAKARAGGPLAPKGMVMTNQQAPGPWAPGMAPKMMRPAKRLINGMPAQEAIAKQESIGNPLGPISPRQLTQSAVRNAISQPSSPLASIQARQAGRMEAQEKIGELGIDEASRQHLAKLATRKPLESIAAR